MEILVILMMISSLFVFGFRSFRLSIFSYILQTIFLVSIFVSLALTYDAKELFSWAIIAFFTKVLFIPFILLFLVKKLGVAYEVEPVGGFLVSPLIAFAFAIGSAMIMAPVLLEFSLIKSETALIGTIFIFMVGVFGFILRNSFIKQILSYCLFENGIHLSLALTAYNSHVLVELGVLSDAIFAIIIMSILAFRYYKIYGTLDTSIADNLKG
ncbi:hydrogenase 4 membrane subunit [Campylobacter hyointestinalis]|uniref:hydrogenase 4 membrane subunit n=1 Tax=Campylobacter hyointestinalis TaxID=198 RepID=UPI0025557E89|nr:hydrogenase 4 membrane subunit [Campylobacter hyointestinalis]MDL2346002.1 hydrogenase 4 membrane subunit [Campylobacter hyointestinalis]MDL2347742.1 hydrogenase 4 membrane subunit [Campylobacter hyointestinalis]MDL2349484.1 hydrogenase 4 membrane subunit [Campylobacter hyointestinalis]MDM1025841.1 hydrogenase 4 membrane subunit [Campylobacter hyointestinalis]MDM1028498.1 hydrogenase 4 membrane subunit [Campylobacter hyointestinalis]